MVSSLSNVASRPRVDTAPVRTPPPTQAEQPLRLGASGPRVTALQQRLNGLGERLPANGQFGPRTLEAVRRFQLRQGIVPADGVVNAKTERAFGLAQRTASTFEAAPPQARARVNLTGAGEPRPGAQGAQGAQGRTGATGGAPRRAGAEAPVTAGGVADTARSAVSTGLGLRGLFRAGLNNARSIASEGFSRTFESARQAARVARAGLTLTAEGVTKKGLTVTGVVSGATALPGTVARAAAGIATAVRTGASRDINRAVADVAETVKGAGGLIKSSAELALDAQKLAAAGRAAASAFVAEVPNASRAAVARVASSVGLGALTGRTAERVASVVGAEVAEAGLRAGETALKGSLARAAGRFAPGINIAIAVADTATAVTTYNDPNASVGRKVTAGLVALGSVTAATDIPIVAQVGAGAAVIAGVIGGTLYPK